MQLNWGFYMNIFQEVTEGTEALASISEEKTLSVMDLIVSGGTASIVIIILLFAMLFVAMYIYFERLFAIKAASKIDGNFMNQIRDHVMNGKLEAAKLLCAQTDSPVARLTEKGISRIGKPLEDINTAIETAGTLEVYKLEKNVTVLATVAGAGPMIGFLGTVIGMVSAFISISQEEGMISPKLLSSGIYTAMITTVAGLIVGIIAYLAYNFLVSRVQKVIHKMEYTSIDFIDLLQEPR